MSWDAQQYLTFSDHRLQPAIDLLARIQGLNGFTPKRVYDLGCGPGNITHHMQTIWPKAKISGADSSTDMLARASNDFPDMDWLQADIGEWHPTETPDLIFSNAALHWLPDHDHLFPKLLNFLPDNGVLAIQIPNNFNRPSHTLVEEAAKKSGCYDQLSTLFNPSPTQSADYYYNCLSAITRDLNIWECDYCQILEGENPVADWTSGTWLRPFMSALEETPTMQKKFEICYRDLIKTAYPTLENGKTMLSFKRLFLLAIK